MEDILAEYSRKYILSKERILEECDEWTLYSFYLTEFLGIEELEIKTTYKSPIKAKDDHYSFSLYENTRSKKYTCQYLWKDSSLNLFGDIFELLERMYNISSMEVLELINKDFCILDDSKEVIVRPIVQKPISKPDTRIRIKSKPFTQEAWDFWNRYHLCKELVDSLDFNKVKLVDFVWFNDTQEYPFKVKELMFAYPEFNTETNRIHYQLYCPYSKEFKFRNDLLENQIFSWNNLKFCKKSKLVITKSKKDIVCINSFEVQAGASRSETTKIKRKTMLLLLDSYEEVILLFDNDEAGIKAAEQYREYVELGLRIEFISKESETKDFSDFLERYGRIKSKELLIELRIL